MKIIVKSQETNLKIRIPTALLLNRLTAAVGARVIEKHVPQDVLTIEGKDLIRLVKEVNRVRKFHKDMPLVDVEDADGDVVKIYL